MSVSSVSRVASKPVVLPAGVNVTISQNECHIKGPKGSITVPIHADVELIQQDSTLKVTLSSAKTYRRKGTGQILSSSIPGTVRSILANAVVGVTQGFERKLTLVGVGFRAQLKGKVLVLNIGFSHPVEFSIPDNVTIEIPTQTEVVIKSADKHALGHVASTIRDFRPPELYKGKGIRYSDEVVILKETKKK